MKLPYSIQGITRMFLLWLTRLMSLVVARCSLPSLAMDFVFSEIVNLTRARLLFSTSILQNKTTSMLEKTAVWKDQDE